MILAAADGGFSLTLNEIISGGTGASIMAALIFVGKLILDRTIPSRSDQRASVGLVLESLTNMVTVLREEKIADATRLADKQARIEILEVSADKDFATISELRSEIIDLRHRLIQKDRHIQLLVTELRKLGATVSGVAFEESAVDSLEITLPPLEVRRVRHSSAGTDSVK